MGGERDHKSNIMGAKKIKRRRSQDHRLNSRYSEVWTNAEDDSVSRQHMAKTGTKEAFLLFIVIQQASKPVPPLNYHQHQDWESLLKNPSTICSIGFVHVRRCWWWFSVEKERPNNTKSEILSKTTHSVKLEFHVARGPLRSLCSLPSLHPRSTTSTNPIQGHSTQTKRPS